MQIAPGKIRLVVASLKTIFCILLSFGMLTTFQTINKYLSFTKNKEMKYWTHNYFCTTTQLEKVLIYFTFSTTFARYGERFAEKSQTKENATLSANNNA